MEDHHALTDVHPNHSTGSTVTYGLRSAFSQICASIAQNSLVFLSGMAFGMPTILVGALNHRVASSATRATSPGLILSDEQSSWLGSFIYLFHPVSSIVSGYAIDSLGRKRMMLLVSVPFLIGWLLIYYAHTPSMLLAAAMLMSLGTGMCEAPLNTYTGEMCEPRLRGALSLIIGAGFSGGILLLFIIHAFTDWRTMSLIAASVPCVAFILITLIPETPAFLITKDKLAEAEASLRWLRGWSRKPKVRVEFETLVRETRAASRKDASGGQLFFQQLRHLGQPDIIRPFRMIAILFCITITASLQPMRPFLVDIFITFGVPMESDHVLVLTGVLSIVCSIASALTINKLGKRRITLVSLAINFVCCALLAVCARNLHWPGWIALTTFCVSYAISCYGILFLPWVMLSEVYPLPVRGVACGLTAAFSSLVDFVTTKTYTNLLSWFGLSGTLFIYTSVSALGFVYIYFHLPETENRTLDEISEFFAQNKESARQFSKPSKKENIDLS